MYRSVCAYTLVDRGEPGCEASPVGRLTLARVVTHRITVRDRYALPAWLRAMVREGTVGLYVGLQETFSSLELLRG